MSKNQLAAENNRLLTEVELELMTQIWRLGKATVKDVISHLPKERSLAYTTVATVMKVLEQKGYLECLKESYAHLFVPLVSKVSYEKSCLEHMVVNIFDGEPVALVQRLLDATSLRKDDIQKIQEALKNLSITKNKRK
jgi:predicted transcriptional regulator